MFQTPKAAAKRAADRREASERTRTTRRDERERGTTAWAGPRRSRGERRGAPRERRRRDLLPHPPLSSRGSFSPWAGKFRSTSGTHRVSPVGCSEHAELLSCSTEGSYQISFKLFFFFCACVCAYSFETRCVVYKIRSFFFCIFYKTTPTRPSSCLKSEIGGKLPSAICLPSCPRPPQGPRGPPRPYHSGPGHPRCHPCAP